MQFIALFIYSTNKNNNCAIYSMLASHSEALHPGLCRSIAGGSLIVCFNRLFRGLHTRDAESRLRRRRCARARPDAARAQLPTLVEPLAQGCELLIAHRAGATITTEHPPHSGHRRPGMVGKQPPH